MTHQSSRSTTRSEVLGRTLTVGTRIDAVIPDHDLGRCDGGELVSRLRRHGPSCPVVMVTGSSARRLHERDYAAGASKVFLGRGLKFAEYLKKILGGR